MGKIYCTECGEELEDSVKFCSKCGVQIEIPEDVGFYCSECGEKLNNGVCDNCGYYSTYSPKNNITTVLGYLFVGLSIMLPLFAIFGIIIGFYLIYKGHKDLFELKLSKTMLME